MTDTKTWEQMTDRERDAWIAEHVFKHTKIHCADGEWYGDGGYGIGVEQVSHYTTDPACDYLVLKHMRETWGHREIGEFVESLKTIRWPRSNVSMPWSLELFAEPGDYSHAAYLAMGWE